MTAIEIRDRPDGRNEPGTTPVTILGLGAMGSALARAFLAAGHPLTVWNRTEARAKPLTDAGAVLADSPGTATAASPLVVVSLLDDAAVHAVLAGAGVRGRTVVNLTSSTPEQAAATSAWLTERGAHVLDGAVMVPTPLVGGDGSLVLYSGPQATFDAHVEELTALGGEALHVGDEHGAAALLDLGMLDLFFASMTGFLHAAAVVGADGISATRFLPFAGRILEWLPGTLEGLARDVDAGHYPGDEDTLAMEAVALDHVVEVSESRGIDPALPAVSRDLARRAVGSGRGHEGFSRVIEELRRRPG